MSFTTTDPSVSTTTSNPKTESTGSPKPGRVTSTGIIAVDTVDEWVDVLLDVKKAAASVAQGDVSGAAQLVDWMSHREIFLHILGGGQLVVNPEPNTTPICGRAVPYSEDVIDIDELRFWDANPRVYAAVRGLPEWTDADPVRRQQLIAERMEKQESTRSVLEGLRLHGGQQEPLIV